MLPRVSYDTIAHLYDTQPYRAKTADSELLTFLKPRALAEPLVLLDVGCGTGNQLVANHPVVPWARCIGVDRSFGMLRQAQRKASDLAWVQADGAELPFRAQCFDFVTCQYALHHMHDKAAVLRAVFRVLRTGGCLVICNLCPQDMADWLYYVYFPAAYRIDLADFWPPEAIAAEMLAIGFVGVTVERQHRRYEQDLRVWLDTVRRRDTCSQLLTIPDAAYEAGVRRLERELAAGHVPLLYTDHVCLVTIRGEKRAGELHPMVQ
jgi:ubiquinone/menaquinone biosynthesis C-methylase UbiE